MTSSQANCKVYCGHCIGIIIKSWCTELKPKLHVGLKQTVLVNISHESIFYSYMGLLHDVIFHCIDWACCIGHTYAVLACVMRPQLTKYPHLCAEFVALGNVSQLDPFHQEILYNIVRTYGMW